MKHRKYIPKTAGPLKSSRGDRGTGISPGELRDDQILLAEGRVASPLYGGPVSLWIDAEYHGLLDLQVWHDDLLHFEPLGDLLVDAPMFGREVVRLLQEAGKLPPGDDFELVSAERGIQREYLAVFECLCRAGHDVSRATAIAWGAGDQESAEEREWLFGRGVPGD